MQGNSDMNEITKNNFLLYPCFTKEIGAHFNGLSNLQYGLPIA
jgi:hypothetical protein